MTKTLHFPRPPTGTNRKDLTPCEFSSSELAHTIFPFSRHWAAFFRAPYLPATPSYPHVSLYPPPAGCAVSDTKIPLIILVLVSPRFSPFEIYALPVGNPVTVVLSPPIEYPPVVVSGDLTSFLHAEGCSPLPWEQFFHGTPPFNPFRRGHLGSLVEAPT